MFTRGEIEKGKVWITSDTHFGHNNIVRYCMRPGFDQYGHHNYNRHNDLMRQMWMERVKPQDIVLHLGDVAMAKEGIYDHCRDLPGKVLWVRGNHDKHGIPGACSEIGWKMIEPFTLVWQDKDGVKVPIFFTHYPIRQLPKGAVNVHGHVHNNPYFGTALHLNVCVEVTGYGPLPLREILSKAAWVAKSIKTERGVGEFDNREASIMGVAKKNVYDFTK